MMLEIGLLQIIKIIVNHVLPIGASMLSLIAYFESRKVRKFELRLKEYELERIEKEREEATRACIEARIINISRGKYRLKIWNSGKATAYNVDFKVLGEYEIRIYRDKVPYEFLEPNKSFEEIVSVWIGSPSKFKLLTTWTDEYGNMDSKEQIVTV